MLNLPAALPVRGNRVLPALFAAALALLLLPLTAAAAPAPAVLTLKTAKVGAPGNPGVGIVPFTDAIYPSCVAAPEAKPPCQEVGAVDYRYGIGQLEVTVAQYVDFLNTVDPKRDATVTSSTARTRAARPGPGSARSTSPPASATAVTTRSATPEWADKPYGFANFLRSARFVNSLYNGQVLSRKTSSANGFRYVTYRVRLSRQTERGMYDMTQAGDDALAQVRLRHPQPGRVDQGRLLRPQRRRHLLLLEVPDQRRRLRRRRR